ncbi:MAG: hypothetical protein WC516_05670 [Patescibacteria group bacterium]|jgi:hypothetical protein
MTLQKSAINEISTNLINFIGKTASVTENFKNELNSAKTKADVDRICNKYKGALRREPTQEDWEVICNIKKSQLPANDGMAADDNKNERSLKDGVIFNMLNQLCSIADTFDNNGYDNFAKFVDELIKKISMEAFKK